MSLLERRYRSVLRLLPASYRAEREEEMVAAFMEAAGDTPDEVNPRPGWGEIASVLALAVRVRLGGTRAAPRFFAWGETVRLLALLGLAYQTAIVVLSVTFLAEMLTLDAAGSVMGAPESLDRLLVIGDTGAAVCWAIAFVAIMRGRARLAKVTALLGVVPGVISLVKALDRFPEIPPVAEAGNLLVATVPVVALLMGFHSDVPPRRRPWWPVLLPIGAGLAMWGALRVAFFTITSELPPWSWLWVDPAGMAVAAFAVAGMVGLIRPWSPPWRLAMAAAGALLLVNRLLMLGYQSDGEANTVVFATVSAQCALLGVLVVALAAAGLRALPAAQKDPSVAP